MSSESIGIPQRLGQACATALGIVLAATPVALWVAWTPALLAAVLLSALGCALLLVLVTDALAHREDQAGRLRPRAVDGAMLEEVHGLFPMIYHHSGRRSLRFRRTMQHLSQALERTARGAAPR